MQLDKNNAERIAGPSVITTRWQTYILIVAITILIFITVGYFAGDRFKSTPTFGGADGKTPAAAPVPAR